MEGRISLRKVRPDEKGILEALRLGEEWTPQRALVELKKVRVVELLERMKLLKDYTVSMSEGALKSGQVDSSLKPFFLEQAATSGYLFNCLARSRDSKLIDYLLTIDFSIGIAERVVRLLKEVLDR